MFQSLIGRLKTTIIAGAPIKTETNWFQSLIGRLKTDTGGAEKGVLDQFQSLIGRLKTWLGA